MSDRPHFSVSQLNLFLMCGEAYRRRYVEGDKEPPEAALLAGTVFHSGVEHNMRQKITTGVDLDPSEPAELAIDQFEKSVSDEVEAARRGSFDDFKPVVANSVKTHMVQQAWAWQPEQVEQRLDLLLPESSHDFVGYIDFVGQLSDRYISQAEYEPSEKQPWIIDWKTSGKKPSKNVAHDNVQLSAYAAVASEQYGWTGTINVGQIFTVRGKTTEWRLSERDAADTVRFARMVNVVLASINAGIFPPAQPDHWKCNPKWCGYYRTCPYVRERQITDREKMIEAITLLTKGNDDGKEK